MSTDPSDKVAPRTIVIVVAALLAAIAGFGAVYVSLAPPVHDEPPQAVSTAPSAPTGTQATPSGGGLKAYAKGKMVTFVAKPAPEAVPEITFQDSTGKTRSLAEWRGKVVLLNIWATWCAPCRREMPALDALKRTKGGPEFDVVALSTDRDGIAKAKAFLDEIKVDALEPLVDPTSRSASALKVIGMPTTLLLDREGRELGRLVGPAEWDSDDAQRLVEAAIKGAP
ncbi:MAG: TlpA disulfide reductase family protein [Hyphomicrobiaceae bacterium]